MTSSLPEEEKKREVFNCAFENAPQGLDCDVCDEILLHPVTLTCGHSFCKECLEGVLKHYSTGINTGPCPRCRKDFGRAELNINITMNAWTGNLEMHCLNPDCQWNGSYEEAKDHQNTCPKFIVECTNPGCLHVTPRESLQAHLKACPKQKRQCEKCGWMVTGDDLIDHQQQFCAYSEVQCPLDCGETMPWCDVTVHLTKCGERAVSCNVTGCKKILRKKCLKEHMKDAAESHNVLQAGEIQRLRTVIHEKRWATEKVCFKEGEVLSFGWTVEEVMGDNECFASPITYHNNANGNRWRGLMKQSGVFLQLLSAVNPVLADVRILLISEGAVEVLKQETKINFKEGEMVKYLKGRDLLRKLETHGRITLRFVIHYLMFI